MPSSCRSRTNVQVCNRRIRAASPPEIPSSSRTRCVGTDAASYDPRTRELLAALNHHETTCTARYRKTRHEYPSRGGCQVPIGSYAKPIHGESGRARWSARRTVRRSLAANTAVRRKMPNKWGFRCRRSY
ncbi:hypothetical protein ACVXHB_15870 [Escherichia coli]